MKKLTSLFASVLISSAVLMLPLFSTASSIPGQYIILFNSSVTDVAGTAQQLVSDNGGQLGFVYTSSVKGFSATLSDQAVASIQGDPRVAEVEQDQTVQLAAAQIFPPYTGLDRIDQHVPEPDNTYHYSDAAGTGVSVYIIDSGIRTSHVEFGTRATGAVDFVGDGNGANDCNGHGTEVASIVGGASTGVAKSTHLIGVRAFDCAGSSTESRVLAALDWVSQNAVTPALANMSFETASSPALDASVNALLAQGITVVAAAGNDGGSACSVSPARVSGALTVGYTSTATANSRPDPMSNTGPCVDLYAPANPVSAASIAGDSSYAQVGGSSFAAAMTSGAAALFLSSNPSADPATVHQAVMNQATMLPYIVGTTVNDPFPMLYTLGFGSVYLDTTAPSAPTTLKASTPSSNEIDLSWTGSSDNIAVDGYDIYRNGQFVGITYKVSFIDVSVLPNTTYTYTVKAFDARQNFSGASNSVTITTPGVVPFAVTSSSVSNISRSAATIRWSTNASSVGVVKVTNQQTGTVTNSADTVYATSHALQFSGLAANTNYSYTVTATDTHGNTAIKTGTFRTTR